MPKNKQKKSGSKIPILFTGIALFAFGAVVMIAASAGIFGNPFSIFGRQSHRKPVARKHGRILGTSTAAPCSKVGYDQICKKTALAVPPQAGQAYVDPDFGTQVVRLTDQITAPQGASLASDANDQIFNADGSMFLVLYTGAPAHVYAVQPSAAGDTAVDLGALPQALVFNGAQWDATDPNALYAVITGSTNNGVVKYTVTSRNPLRVTSTFMGGFGAMPYSEVLGTRLDINGNAQYFAVAGNDFPDDQTDFDYIAVLDSRTGVSWGLNTVGQLYGYRFSNFEIDQSGQYVLISTTTRYDSDTDPSYFLWDVRNNTTTQLTTDAVMAFDGDFVIGNGKIINTYGSDFVERSADKPQSFRVIDLTLPQKNDMRDLFDQTTSSQLLQIGPNPAFMKSFYANADLSGKSLQQTTLGSHIYKISPLLAGNKDLAAPDEVQYKGRTLTQTSAVPNDADQWYYDSVSDSLYVWLTDDYRVINIANFNIFDWRPMTDEIVFFSQNSDGSWQWQRLLHHRMAYTNTSETQPRAFLSPDGKHLVFVSNWNGTLKNATDRAPRTDVFFSNIGVVPQTDNTKTDNTNGDAASQGSDNTANGDTSSGDATDQNTNETGQ